METSGYLPLTDEELSEFDSYYYSPSYPSSSRPDSFFSPETRGRIYREVGKNAS